MGQGSSKPSPSSTQHVFTSETPVRFSQDLIDALQASPETDSTRSKDLELHIQSRVTAELARLSESTSTNLAELQERISAPEERPNSALDGESSLGGADLATKAEAERARDLGRASVQKEIESLKRKLGGRRTREDVLSDEDVEKSRAGVVACLRRNDRRPLDCWEEVEAFRREVGRLEKGFLIRVME